MYEIKNFIVTPYMTCYKCFASENHIYFTQYTDVKEIDVDYFVPRGEVLEFYYFGNINAYLYQEKHCIGKMSMLFFITYFECYISLIN